MGRDNEAYQHEMGWMTKAARDERQVQVHPKFGWRLTLLAGNRILNVDHMRRLRYEHWMSQQWVDLMREAGLIVTHDTLPWRWGSSPMRYAETDDD